MNFTCALITIILEKKFDFFFQVIIREREREKKKEHYRNGSSRMCVCVCVYVIKKLHFCLFCMCMWQKKQFWMNNRERERVLNKYNNINSFCSNKKKWRERELQPRTTKNRNERESKCARHETEKQHDTYIIIIIKSLIVIFILLAT